MTAKRKCSIPVLLRGEITGMNAAGGYLVVLKANGADNGRHFWTDRRSLVFAGPGCDDVVNVDTVIAALEYWEGHAITDAEAWHLRQVIGDIKGLPRVDLLELEGQT